MSNKVKYCDYYYQVAEHGCKLSLPASVEPHNLIPSGEPFRVQPTSGDLVICSMTVHDEKWQNDAHEHFVLLNHAEELLDAQVWIYESESAYLIKHCYDSGKFICHLFCNKDFSESKAFVPLDNCYSGLAMTCMFMIAFSQTAVLHNTVLVHASVVVNEQTGYAFLGKSGTGKSTHSRLWLKNIPGTWLLNDDNPAVRVGDDGAVYIYGTPWSGKTPCYKNEKVVLGAFVKLVQAPVNEIYRLDGLNAFSGLLPSCSSMRWNKKLYNALCDILERIIGKVQAFKLNCLPDDQAAVLSYNTININTKELQKTEEDE